MTRSFVRKYSFPRGGNAVGTEKKSNSGNIVERVTQLVSPITAEHGLMLWDVRFVKEGADWILRVTVDREDAPVSIDDCVHVSRQLNPLLDEADPIPQSYCLEVTSPGAERELTRPAHFAYYEGYPVNIKFYRPDETGQREIAGILITADAETLTVETEDGTSRTFDRKAIAAVRAIDDFTDDGTDI